MVKSKPEPDLNLDASIEIMAEYRRGLWNIGNACRELSKVTGLELDVCRMMLKDMKRHNVTQIRGYSKEPERLRKSKEGTRYAPKK
tara:strand:- start:1873 stop:2130 length:258 start_codon:yes stop_codon:yes gene_type:complete